MRFIFLINCVLFTVIQPVQAESSCSSIDLREEFSWKMRNQGEVSWCYAHAAADYLQFKEKTDLSISAADIALQYNHRRWPRFLKWLTRSSVPETGLIRNAIWDILPLGYCPENRFPSESWNKRILKGAQTGKLVQVPLKEALADVIRLSRQYHDQGNFEEPSYAYEFEGVDSNQFMSLVSGFGPAEVLDALRSAACDSHRTPFRRSSVRIERFFKDQQSFMKIDSILDQHQPLTVDFFYGFLNDRDHFSYDPFELHTTLLVGRRFNSQKNECEYLIKNSYGPDCAEYDRNHECEGGYVWVSGVSLERAMTTFVVMTDERNAISQTDVQIQDVGRFRLSSILRLHPFRILKALFGF